MYCWPSPGMAFGPGVHLREAQRYAELHPEWASPELLPYLYLGAFFPDVQSAGVKLPIGTHNKGLANTLMELAETPWQRAFATGYQLHIASDTSAQVVYIPWLTAQTGLFAVNLFGDETLPVEADNELLIEGFGDFFSGSLDVFVDLVWAFVVVDNPDLDAVVAFYLQALQSVVGPSFDPLDAQAQLYGFRDQLKNQLAPFSPDGLKTIIQAAKAMSLAEFLALVSSGALNGILATVPDAVGKSLVADPAEVTRLSAHPVGASPETFFANYDAHFADLGSQIMDDSGYAAWPSYHAKTIQSGILQSLTKGAPLYAHRADVLLFDAYWSHNELSAGSEGIPSEVMASSEWFSATGLPHVITMEVWASPPLVTLDEKVLVGQASAMITPGPAKTVVSVVFDPTPYVTESRVFDITWKLDGDVLPFMSTDFDHLAIHSEAPLFKAPYVPLYGKFPPRLSVVHPAPITENGAVRGHVTAGGAHGIVADVGVAESEAPWMITNVGGAFLIQPLPPKETVLLARAKGFLDLEWPLTIMPGEVSVVHLPMLPVPIVTIEGGCCSDDSQEQPQWITTTASAGVAVDVSHFPMPPKQVRVAVSASGNAVEWVDVESVKADIPCAPEARDGQFIVAYAQADDGPIVQSQPVGVDSTPPWKPTLRIDETSCPDKVHVVVGGTDPHSPIMERQARVVGQPWQQTPAEFVAVGANTVIEGRVRNASGLWSPTAREVVCELPPSLPEDAADDAEPPDGEAMTPDGSGDDGAGDNSPEPADTPKAEVDAVEPVVVANSSKEGGCRTDRAGVLDSPWLYWTGAACALVTMGWRGRRRIFVGR